MCVCVCHKVVVCSCVWYGADCLCGSANRENEAIGKVAFSVITPIGILFQSGKHARPWRRSARARPGPLHQVLDHLQGTKRGVTLVEMIDSGINTECMQGFDPPYTEFSESV